MDHIFIICAYKENPYLEQCVRSVVNQSLKSRVLISTSTPNQYIENIAQKYNLEIIVNHGVGNQADNMNFAYSKADAKYATLCHQDDYYHKDYLKNIALAEKSAKQAVIFFTDYYEDRDSKIIKRNPLLFIKRLMLCPLRSQRLRGVRWVRRFILKFGSPICCPSVTYNKEVVRGPVFDQGCPAILDWKAWVRLSALEGEFCFIPKPLMCHRIHEGSETSEYIHDNTRGVQEKEFFLEMWPWPIAFLISKLYQKGQKSNG